MGAALIGGGYIGLKRAQEQQRMQGAEPIPPTPPRPQAPISAFGSNQVNQQTRAMPFPEPVRGNGLSKDRYTDIERGQSSTYLERYSGIPAMPSSRMNVDAPAPYMPRVQGQRPQGLASRGELTTLYTNSMSPYRNDEAPIPSTRVGPGVGYDASVPSADGFHPMLRVVPTDSLTQRQGLPGRVNQGFSQISKRVAPVQAEVRSVPRYFEKSEEYTSTGGHLQTANGPVLRQNFRPDCTNRSTEMPGLRLAGDEYGIGAGHAHAAVTAQKTNTSWEDSESIVRKTDRGWAGTQGVGPSSVSHVAHDARDGWRAPAPKSRVQTGHAPERIGQGGPAYGSAGVKPMEGLQTTQRQTIPAMPSLNVSPDVPDGTMQHPLKDNVASEQLRLPQKASIVQNAYPSAPLHPVPLSGVTQGRVAHEAGRLASSTTRDALSTEMLNMSGPSHTGLASTVRHKYSTFALRDATSAASGLSGPNRAFKVDDKIGGELAPSYQLAVPRPDHLTEGYLHSVTPSQGITYVKPLGVQQNPNVHEVMDDRLDVAIDAVQSLGMSK